MRHLVKVGKTKPIQSQFKANSKPIKANTKPIKANKMPKQTQYEPNQTQLKPISKVGYAFWDSALDIFAAFRWPFYYIGNLGRTKTLRKVPDFATSESPKQDVQILPLPTAKTLPSSVYLCSSSRRIWGSSMIRIRRFLGNTFAGISFLSPDFRLTSKVSFSR